MIIITLTSNILAATIDISITYPWGISYSGGWSTEAYFPKSLPRSRFLLRFSNNNHDNDDNDTSYSSSNSRIIVPGLLLRTDIMPSWMFLIVSLVCNVLLYDDDDANEYNIKAATRYSLGLPK